MLKLKKIGITLLLMMMSLLVVACGEDKSEGEKTANEVVKDEIVYANFRDIRDLNPHNYAGELYAQNILYEGLVKISPKGEIVPSLAESWEISEDGKEYTFHLRKGVLFSDGEKFDANAVKANFDAIMDNKDRHGWLESVRLFNKFEVVDENTFKIYLNEPYFPMMIELGVIRPFRFVSPKAFKNGTTKDGVNEYIGTGPYVLKQNTVDQEAIFEVNEKYWEEKPKVKIIRVKVIPDGQIRALALEKGEIDLLFGKNMIDAETMEKFSTMKGFETKMSEPLSTRMMIVNTTKGALQDKNVRKAIQHVLDKKAISESIFGGSELSADYLLAKTVKYADVDTVVYDYSLEEAGKLLDEAGWKLDANGKRMKDGKPLTIKLNYNNSSVSEKSISKYFQQQLAKIGVDLVINGEEEKSYRDDMKAGNFEISFNISWGTPYDPQSFFGGMRMPAVYGDYAAQEGLADKETIRNDIYEGLITTSEEKRQELFADVLKKLADEAVSSLDISTQVEILNLLQELKKSYSLSYIFVTHDLLILTYICDSVIFFKEGRIVEKVDRLEKLCEVKDDYSKALLDAVIEF
ncbi:nickel ABC transporter substrate-binding protein [Fusobacterium polymorphum]|uniref:nickel ABC transporter substrate-binding protein n=1 Tax=Fusobacterium nucleatum subsp. polymorphum TaxID=76857 RepID=UPI00300AFC8E